MIDGDEGRPRDFSEAPIPRRPLFLLPDLDRIRIYSEHGEECEFDEPEFLTAIAYVLRQGHRRRR
jgi:hypothetical protein